MPQNLKEDLQFTFLMAIGMVLGMASYNSFLRTGGFSAVPESAIKEYFLAFPIALLIGSPLAKKLTKTFFPANWPFAVGMGLFTPIIMVPIMTSVIAVVFYQNYALTGCLKNMGMNLLCAWPLQLLVVGPAVRYSFKQIKKMQG